MTPKRLTWDYLHRIRTFLQKDWLCRDGESALTYARELFDELSAVKTERDLWKAKAERFERERDDARRGM